MLEFKFKLCAHDETSLWKFHTQSVVQPASNERKKFVLNYNKAGNVNMKQTLALAE